MSELVGKGSKERWYPIAVSTIKSYIGRYDIPDEDCPVKAKIISNIAYNIQYIEYLQKTLRELNLSSVLFNQSVKTVIIVSVSVIEAILYLVCCKNGLTNKNKKKLIKSVCNDINLDGVNYTAHTKYYKIGTEGDVEILKLEQMITKVERKKQCINVPGQFFKDMNHLKRLRNKIHLQAIDSELKTDLDAFWEKEGKLACKNLSIILAADIFSVPHSEYDTLTPAIFNFLEA